MGRQAPIYLCRWRRPGDYGQCPHPHGRRCDITVSRLTRRCRWSRFQPRHHVGPALAGDPVSVCPARSAVALRDTVERMIS
ncbi:hypothetical protein LAUMK4_04933 [Mycobacterium persicum]|uniref:Uncharacterized protein n=1 Tax=Mycobacterium persicum TaxID=1487726 RepID=A0AB38UZV4_9MYCO|nr:hypothetical protein LAUMK15_05234 [Mycobacterium persicum]VAZ86073.1 hypothetical protein LAUMK42_04916 [Mycobacterium persicum]VBA30022.1 hypothetical protein LAUMK4_04933 [Mycobacterium persicum]